MGSWEDKLDELLTSSHEDRSKAAQRRRRRRMKKVLKKAQQEREKDVFVVPLPPRRKKKSLPRPTVHSEDVIIIEDTSTEEPFAAVIDSTSSIRSTHSVICIDSTSPVHSIHPSSAPIPSSPTPPPAMRRTRSSRKGSASSSTRSSVEKDVATGDGSSLDGSALREVLNTLESTGRTLPIERSSIKSRRATSCRKRTTVGELNTVMEDEEDEEGRGEENKKEEKQTGKQQRKKGTAKKEELEKKSEEEVDMDVLVGRACTPGKGQKKLLKELYSRREEVVKRASESSLRRLLWENSVISVPEGRKLGSVILIHLKPNSAFATIKKKLCKREAYANEKEAMEYCGYYSELLVGAWRIADKMDNENTSGTMRMQVEMDCFSVSVSAAIRIPKPIGHRFFQIISALYTERPKMDAMIFRCFEPVLWRFLRVPNDICRLAANGLFLRFFPIVKGDRSDATELISNSISGQMVHVFEALRDDCIEIRIVAVKEVIRTIAELYTALPMVFVKEALSTIVDGLALDKVPSVRVAVLEAVGPLLENISALNAAEKVLRTLYPRAINDRSERVREAAFSLLHYLRKTPFGRFTRSWQILKPELALQRLEVETSEPTRMAIVQILFTSLCPLKAHADEKMRRIALLVKEGGRQAALTFHRLIFPMGLIDAKQAALHVRYLVVAVYKNWRKGQPESENLPDMDTTSASLNSTMMSNDSMSMTASQFPPPDESSEVFRRDKVIIECAVVLWSTIIDKMTPEDKKSMDNLMAKVFGKLFDHFRTTSLLGTVMCIGSLIPQNMHDKHKPVLSRIRENVDEEVIEPYLEAAAKWDLEELMEIIGEGLAELPDMITASPLSSPPKKKGRTRYTPVERLRQALYYLKYSLTSEMISHQVRHQCREKFLQFYDALSSVRDVIAVCLESEEGDEEYEEDHASQPGSSTTDSTRRTRSTLPADLLDDDVMVAYDSLSVLGITLLNLPWFRESDDFTRLANHVHAEMDWARAIIASKLKMNKKDFRYPLMIRVCQAALGHAENVLTSCVDLPEKKKRREENEEGEEKMEVDEEESERDYAAKMARRQSIVSTISTVNEVEYVTAVDRLLKAIAYDSKHGDLLISCFALAEQLMSLGAEVAGNEVGDGSKRCGEWAVLWIKKAIEEDEENLGADIDLKKYADALLSFLRALKKHGENIKDGACMRVMSIMLKSLLNTIDKEGLTFVSDPREHTYEVSAIISCLLHRCIMKHKPLLKEYMTIFSATIVDTATGTDDDETELKRIAVFTQLAWLSDPACIHAANAMSAKQRDTTVIRRHSEEILEIVERLRTRFEKMEKKETIDEGAITVVKELFDIHEM